MPPARLPWLPVDKATPLTFLPLDDGKITVTFYNGITLAGDIHFTINDGQEQTIAKNTAGAYDIQAKKGDVVQLYSINTSLGGGAVAGTRGGTRAIDEGAKYINIRPSMKTEIFGNVMSLLKGKDNLEGATAIEAKNAFYGLFAGAENLARHHLDGGLLSGYVQRLQGHREGTRAACPEAGEELLSGDVLRLCQTEPREVPGYRHLG